MSSFTPTQGRYLSFIRAYIDGFGEPPAESEMKAINDPKHPEHEEMLEWGGDRDPAEFDPEEATQAMWSALFR